MQNNTSHPSRIRENRTSQMSGRASVLGAWRRLGITGKASLAFSSLVALILLVAIYQSYTLFSVQKKMEDTVAGVMEARSVVLRMDSGLQRAMKLQHTFMRLLPLVGYDTARDLYAMQSYTELSDVIKLGERLKEMSGRARLSPELRVQLGELDYFLSVAGRCAVVFNEALGLLRMIAGEEVGFIFQLDDLANQLLVKLQGAGDERLLTLYYEMRSFEKDYFVTQKAAFMTQAFNVAVKVRKRLKAKSTLSPDKNSEIYILLNKYREISQEILHLDVESTNKLLEFDQQVESVTPVAESLITLISEEVVIAQQEIRDTRNSTNVLTAVVVLAAAILATTTALIWHRSITSNLLALTNAASELRKGNLDARARVSSDDELGHLAQTFNKMAEEIRKRARDQSAKARDLEKANERLRVVDEMKSNFLSLVSHELRTPLTSIRGYSKMLEKEFSRSFYSLAENDARLQQRGGRILNNLSVIEKESLRLTELINDVLDLARIESGRMEWRDAMNSPLEMVATAVETMKGHYAQKPQLDLEMEVRPELPQMLVDKDKVHQILINLLSNALKFTEEGGVSVKADKWGEHSIRFIVIDTGIGIGQDDLQSVFDKFQQLGHDTLTDKPTGTGLGLAICKEIVDHYGGQIWVESEEGKGSKFTVELPLDPNVDPVDPLEGLF